MDALTPFLSHSFEDEDVSPSHFLGLIGEHARRFTGEEGADGSF